jgi:hypothetical protein
MIPVKSDKIKKKKKKIPTPNCDEPSLLVLFLDCEWFLVIVRHPRHKKRALRAWVAE